ncbi:penicillin-binding protein activator [Marinobacter sp. M216]|uniref:Penicillin-binding protein activator n=1 Tax=Marinobacter albus TaxID=3030833 RepID=A0ABT7HI06_9GAMM|nr:penicillin-binding protein activator [Marinobacter sp. M216]MDK9559475.1 penicillin-binding protein activator [Marinobacter sp. M216]
MPPLDRRHKPNNPEYFELAMIKNPTKHRALATAFTVALLSAGCASVNLQSHVAQTPQQALELASQETNRETAQRYLLRIASRFQDQGNHQAARTLLQSSQLAQAEPALESQKRLLAMASATALEDDEWARTLVADLPPDSITDYGPELMGRAAQLQSQAFALAGQPLPAAMTLVLQTQTDSSANPQQLHDQIWQLLKTVPDDELNAASSSAIGYEAQGWLELAASVRTPEVELDEQGRSIRGWQNNWPGHPAAQVLPSELQLIASLAESRPETIALALPLKGPLATAGKAIRDGFIAAYYSDESADRSKTDIRIVDTSDSEFTELYKELSSKDVDLIVGPLEKEALTRLGSMNTLPVPALGLNYLPVDQKVPDGLYQFGLSAEDEARQIADRLDAEGLRHALVLIPQGEWGDRVEAALLQRMGANGSTALDIERFFRDDNLRAVTADLLGITTSRDRAIQVERTIGLDLEFEPRRRQDADAIVMVAEPTIARQFKPLFAFYFGGDLPVYSPSIVYEGTPDPARDRDLDQVIFTDTPWILGEGNELRMKADKHLSGTRGQLGRLFAMGADAWQLSKRLPLLRQVETASIDGQTGVLTMTSEGSIHREQLWAQFQNGTPKLLPDPEPRLSETEPSPVEDSSRSPGLNQ